MALQEDFQKYFDTVKPGQVVQVPGGGTVTRNEDGTATFSNGAYNYTYGANTSTSDVAANVPALGEQWAKTYGTPAAQAPFSNLDEFKAWEAANISTPDAKFAQGYKTPDYVKMMGLTIQGGNDDAYKRYLFFKNNPQFAQDYANLHKGQQSKFATDGSTLQRTNLASLSKEAQGYYGSNPNELKGVEAFASDPELYARSAMGMLSLPKGEIDYLRKHTMDAQGNVSASNNTVGAAQWRSPFYQRNEYNPVTGGVIDGGKEFDPVTGRPMSDGMLYSGLAQQGVGGDTEVAHLTPGELVVPKEVVQANPGIKKAVEKQAGQMGIDASGITVGRDNFINPKTGLPMFATQAEEDAYNAWIQTPGAKEYQAWTQSQSTPSTPNASSAAPAVADGDGAYKPYETTLNDRDVYGGHSSAASAAPGTTSGGGMLSAAGATSATGAATGTASTAAPAGSAVTGSTGSSGAKTDYTSQISNIFRNTFGRDPNQSGLDYWNEQANKYGGLDKIYQHMVSAGTANKEKVNGIDYAAASSGYQGPMGGETGNSTVDEWFYNVLGRAPTDAERQTYQPALEYRLKTGGVDMANTIYTMFLRNNNVDPATAKSMAEASQLYGQKKPQAPTDGSGSGYLPNLNQQVDFDTMTIEGRMGALLATDGKGGYTNPAVRQAVDRAMQQMAGRGLLNSSMAQQAAQEAAIAKAIEIVGPDAQRYYDQSTRNQDAQNVFARDQQLHKYDLDKMSTSQKYDLDKMAASNGYDIGKMGISQKYDLEKIAAQGNIDMDKFNKDLEYRYAALKMDANTSSEARDVAHRNALEIENIKSVNNAYDLYLRRITDIDNNTTYEAEAKIKLKNEAGRDFEAFAKAKGIAWEMNLSERFKTQTPATSTGATAGSGSSSATAQPSSGAGTNDGG